MYGPASSKDTGTDVTNQVVAGRAGVFYGIFAFDALADLTIEAFDGTADTDDRIWVGRYEFATSLMSVQPGAGGVSFTKGLFVKFSAAPDKAVVHFA